MGSLGALVAVLGSTLLTVGAQPSGYGGYGYGSSGTYGAGPSSTNPGGSPACTVTAYLAQPWPLWGANASHADTINFFVVNNLNYTRNTPWTFTVTNPAYKTVEPGAWNWDQVSVSGGSVRGQAKLDWQALSPGASVNLGGIIGADSDSIDAFKPQTATVNETPCSIAIRT